MAVIFGMDFGTCFSSVYFVHGERYMSLSPTHEKNMIPTVFYHDSKQGNLVGSRALKAGKIKPQRMSSYIKRRYDEEMITLENDAFEPEQIVGHIVGYLVDSALESLKNTYHIDDPDVSVVLTIPVTYGEKWRKMLIGAVKAKNVNIKAVIQEPVAAAVHFLEENPTDEELLLVYDLGGGTTDVSLIQCTGNPEQPYTVLSQDGEEIGGNDWDERLLTLICRKLDEQIEDMTDEQKERFFDAERSKLLDFAREIKETLSDVEVAEESFEIRGNLYDLRITREEFEACTKKLLEKTIQTVRRAIKGQPAFREVILVGGGSRMPQVKERMEREFPDCKIRLSNPEFAVAMGAARYGAIASPAPVQLRSAHSYGIIFERETQRMVRNLIFKDVSLPASGSFEWPLTGQILHFSVQEGDEQTEEIVPLTQSRYTLSVTVWFSEKPAADAICVTRLELDNNGLLKMNVLDQNGNELSGASVTIA